MTRRISVRRPDTTCATQTGETSCLVKPLYSDDQRAPFYTTVTAVQSAFFPPYPEVPVPVFWNGFESGDTSAWSLSVP